MEEFESQADEKSQENATNEEKYVTVAPSPLPRMKQYMAKKVHKQSTVIYRSLKLDHRPDRALDSFQIIGALESLFIGVYNTSIARRSLDPSAQQRMCTMPPLSSFETVYSDPLTKPKAAESTDGKGPYVRGRSNESGSPSSVEESDVLLNEACPYNRYKFIKGAVVQSNRMRLLTYLLFLVRDEIKTLSEHVHGNLYRLALLLHPVVRHTQSRSPGLREQSESQKNLIRTDDNEQGDRTTENPIEAVDQPKTPSRKNSDDDDDELSDKEPVRMDKVEKSRRKILRSSARSAGTGGTSCPRLQGLQPEFLTELLHCIQRIIRPDMIQLHSSALDALEARANYELWTAPLLMIDAMRDLPNRPIATSARLMSDVFVQTNCQQLFSGAEKNQQTTPTSELNPQQLSLASAYCGLWSDLVEKRELTRSNIAISPKDMRQSDMVRLAQNKFMRSIVTNANFRTHKPPDDITITQDQYRRSSGPPTQQTDQNKLSFVRDIEQWEGNIEDLVIEEKHSLASPKSWLKKFGNAGQKLPKSGKPP
ncbi:hypothetical protein CSKR_102587 [Clonorchis sinensis]|uniref:Uncharacterized protein n=1 Tax=Clonorchis sinensis TaxID=79923 RepID=A0A419PJZ5_CLOSI|nr:hypothetical protein CSKR_102587 [Clonorchis sinensis]